MRFAAFRYSVIKLPRSLRKTSLSTDWPDSVSRRRADVAADLVGNDDLPIASLPGGLRNLKPGLKCRQARLAAPAILTMRARHAKLLSLSRTVALSNAFKGATPHFKPQHVKRDVAEGKQSNLRYVARFRIDDERELRADCGSIGIDPTSAVLSEKRAWLSFF
jgi:hypothetical protein